MHYHTILYVLCRDAIPLFFGFAAGALLAALLAHEGYIWRKTPALSTGIDPDLPAPRAYRPFRMEGTIILVGLVLLYFLYRLLQPWQNAFVPSFLITLAVILIVFFFVFLGNSLQKTQREREKLALLSRKKKFTGELTGVARQSLKGTYSVTLETKSRTPVVKSFLVNNTIWREPGREMGKTVKVFYEERNERDVIVAWGVPPSKNQPPDGNEEVGSDSEIPPVS